MTDFCRIHEIPHEICGKLVLATNELEIASLKKLMVQGQRNGLQKLRWLKQEQIREIEPHAGGIAGLHVPQEGIVDYHAVCLTLKRSLIESNIKMITNYQVKNLLREQSRWRIDTEHSTERFDFLVNCGGLQSDRIASLAGCKTNVRIIPFRGEYYKLKTESRRLVRHLIYPVPDSKFPFLGVHFTRMICGEVEAGPNAVLALAREGYTRRAFNAKDTRDSIFFLGLWKFLSKHPQTCSRELAMSLSPTLFCKALRRLVPEIGIEDMVPGEVGIRAQAMAPNGKLIQDFYFESSQAALHVINAPSPAATASLAIGEMIAEKVLSTIEFPRN